MFTINTLLLYYLPFINLILNLTIILCQFSIVYINKPINSLLYLIILLLHFGIQLIFFNYEFFFVLLIIVYLGGIAILFLSAVMTLTIFKKKIINNTNNFKNLINFNFLQNLYFNLNSVSKFDAKNC